MKRLPPNGKRSRSWTSDSTLNASWTWSSMDGVRLVEVMRARRGEGAAYRGEPRRDNNNNNETPTENFPPPDYLLINGRSYERNPKEK